MFLSDQSVGSSYFGNESDKSLGVGIIDLDDIFQEGHTSKQDSMTFFFEAGGYFIQELIDVFWYSFDDFDGGKDSFFSDIS